MLRSTLRPFLLRALQIGTLMVACCIVSPSIAMDKSELKTAENPAVESEGSESKLSKSKQDEIEFRKALDVELKRRKLTQNSIVCETVARRGSRIRQRQCMTVAEWTDKLFEKKYEVNKLHANRKGKAWNLFE